MDYTPHLIKTLNSLGTLKANEPLKNHTTFKTGGPADILIHPSSRESTAEILQIAEKEGIPVTVIGGGSNLLVGDRGIRGIVICLSGAGKAAPALYSKNEGVIYADAGIQKEDFINYAIDEGYEGVEFMAGIPGCMGGGIIMNAGTNLGSFIDILDRVDIIDKKGAFRTMPVTREMFSYRRFDPGEAGTDAIITGGYFKLPGAADPRAIRKTVDDILSERSQKHPLSYPSAGSVFKNPEGHSSWKLIDNAGLKGKRIGGAMVSELHTNFIINREEATSRDIRDLIELVREKVEEQFNVWLETEIRMIGEF
ncbi:MAG: UDP-N-acetylmuramate dehydrogenase [bacterium]|nr:UDP-N-acetylmuramate dehydrogenase [bacterium]